MSSCVNQVTKDVGLEASQEQSQVSHLFSSEGSLSVMVCQEYGRFFIIGGGGKSSSTSYLYLMELALKKHSWFSRQLQSCRRKVAIAV